MENNKFLCLAKKILWLFFAFFWTIQSAAGGTILHKSRDGVSFQINKIAEGLGVPWGMVFISPDQILFIWKDTPSLLLCKIVPPAAD
jgi:hypothetical protein